MGRLKTYNLIVSKIKRGEGSRKNIYLNCWVGKIRLRNHCLENCISVIRNYYFRPQSSSGRVVK